MSELLDLQAGLLAYLRGQASLAAWLGNPARVYDQAPVEAIYPYVSFGRVSAQAIGGVEADVTEQVLNLICVSRFGGSEEVKAIAAELRLLLDGAALDIAGLVSLRVTYIDVFRAADQRTTYALVRVRAVTEAD